MGSNAIPMEMSCALRVAETEILFGKLAIHLRGEKIVSTCTCNSRFGRNRFGDNAIND